MIRQIISIYYTLSTLNFLEENPRKIVYFGASDVDGEKLLRPLLNTDDESSIASFSSLTIIQSVDLPTFCHAVILDMRVSKEDASVMIQWVGELQCPVALICLCEDYGQLEPYQAKLSLINDMVIADSLKEGELTLRITRAIGSRRTDLQRRQDQELLNELLDSIPDAIYFKDKVSRFIRVNKAMSAFFGKEVEDLIGKTDFDFFAEEHAKQSFKDERDIMSSGKPLIGKLEQEKYEDGSVGWVNTTKVPLHNKSGKIIGTMGISRNVTEQVKKEQMLKEVQRKLDQGS